MIGTPLPDATATSFTSEGFGDVDRLGFEQSFVAPANREILKAGKRHNLNTPGASRDPLQLLPNGIQTRAAKPEFTPLMKSVARTNMSKKISMSSRKGPKMPDTPGMALPRLEESMVSTSSAGRNDFTPMPRQLSSSVNSTPLAQLPARDGAVVNEGNVMTLREQENIIDKIEKENFGLKMKIHFLEENLSKRGSDFNQAALKENTDLKVTRITMQRELHKFKKTLAQAERDTDLYRRQLEDYKERVRQKKVDETVRAELSTLKVELQQKDEEVEELRQAVRQKHSADSSEAEKLRAELEDLQAEMRERERQLDEKDDEIDLLKSNAKRDSSDTAELEEEVEAARQEITELKEALQEAKKSQQQTQRDYDSAEEDKKKAEGDLRELQEEMANKSIVPQGLSRQLEEKATQFEDQYHALQSRFRQLQKSLEEKSQNEKSLQEQLRSAEKEGSSNVRHLQQDFETVQQKSESFERKLNNATRQIESINKELAAKADEKDLLQSRHDALTTESAQLQDDLARARKNNSVLEASLEAGKQETAHEISHLRSHHKSELDHLTKQIDTLHKEASHRDEQRAVEVENWVAERRTLEAAKNKAEEKANGLQRTVDKLQDAQGTLSGHEIRLQEALESEKQRYEQEERILSQQIRDLNQDLSQKRAAVDETRSELSNIREELRISVREQALLKEKVADLEDEIEVLQTDVEQEHVLVEQLQSKSSSTTITDAHVVQLKKEKLDLQKLLTDLRLKLTEANQTAEAAGRENLELEHRFEEARQQANETLHMQQASRDLRRDKQRLEKDLEKARIEQASLAQTNKALEEELEAEIDRAATEEHKLNLELDQLRTKKLTLSENGDKELTLAKNKIHRLEVHIHDLENALKSNSYKLSSPSVDVSTIRHDLEEARKNETAAAKRESDIKASNRELKMKVNGLERQLHEARLSELKAQTPSSSGSSHSPREIAQLREEVFNARASLKRLGEENQGLRSAARKLSQDDTHHAVLEAQLESKQDEVAGLLAKMDLHNQLVDTLRADLARVRSERDDARRAASKTIQDNAVTRMRHELKRLRAERDDARGTTLQIAGQSKEVLAQRSELLRLREERQTAISQANAVEKELNIIHNRYETMLESLTSGDSHEGVVGDKEWRGLMKEILWLKAKCRREERLRRDLAWSKTYLENSEAMRIQCNQIDLRILREMGIDIERKAYEKPLSPAQKLRAVAFGIIATLRLRKASVQWQSAKQIGDELARKKQPSLTSRLI